MCNFPEDCTPLRMRCRRPRLWGSTVVGSLKSSRSGYLLLKWCLLGLFLPSETRLEYGRFTPRATGDGMEAPPPTSDVHAPAGFVAVPDPRRTELLLEALKVALATPGEHRLFRSGRLAGLFPARTGIASEVALQALRDGLLETVRTEAKGKFVTEWV